MLSFPVGVFSSRPDLSGPSHAGSLALLRTGCCVGFVVTVQPATPRADRLVLCATPPRSFATTCSPTLVLHVEDHTLGSTSCSGFGARGARNPDRQRRFHRSSNPPYFPVFAFFLNYFGCRQGGRLHGSPRGNRSLLVANSTSASQGVVEADGVQNKQIKLRGLPVTLQSIRSLASGASATVPPPSSRRLRPDRGRDGTA